MTNKMPGVYGESSSVCFCDLRANRHPSERYLSGVASDALSSRADGTVQGEACVWGSGARESHSVQVVHNLAPFMGPSHHTHPQRSEGRALGPATAGFATACDGCRPSRGPDRKRNERQWNQGPRWRLTESPKGVPSELMYQFGNDSLRLTKVSRACAPGGFFQSGLFTSHLSSSAATSTGQPASLEG